MARKNKTNLIQKLFEVRLVESSTHKARKNKKYKNYLRRVEHSVLLKKTIPFPIGNFLRRDKDSVCKKKKKNSIQKLLKDS